jgi:putative transcriptional regulator
MDVIVKVEINSLLEEYRISLRELSRRADIRHAALSELANQKRESISIDHIRRIAQALKINDMNKIISIEFIEE